MAIQRGSVGLAFSAEFRAAALQATKVLDQKICTPLARLNLCGSTVPNEAAPRRSLQEEAGMDVRHSEIELNHSDKLAPTGARVDPATRLSTQRLRNYRNDPGGCTWFPHTVVADGMRNVFVRFKMRHVPSIPKTLNFLKKFASPDHERCCIFAAFLLR